MPRVSASELPVPALASPLGSLLEPPRVSASGLLLVTALPLLRLPFSALPRLVSVLESSPVPALELPLESLLEPPRVSASEVLVPALAPPLESLLELPRVSASVLLLVSAS